MVSKKPKIVYLLFIISGIFVLLESILEFIGIYNIAQYTSILLIIYRIFPILGMLCGIGLILCGYMTNSTDVNRVKVWSILGILLGFFSLFIAFGGFIIGFILAIIAGIFGLKYKGE